MRAPAEILATLDDEASVDAMPFMPEMLQYAGKRFRVSSRVEKICDTVSGEPPRSLRMRDTVLLDDLRCEGSAHGGCQAGCRLYWKEEWLRRVDPASESDGGESGDHADALARLEALAREATVAAHGADGTSVETYRCQATEAVRGEHLAFVGRINPEKGPALAVEIARRTARPLHVAAKIDPLDVDYYRAEIEPLFRSQGVVFVGELEEPDKPAFYATAAATLFPSDWPEPFGLVMIESMAAGTPVIALRRGSVPEIIIDGVTGFICDNVDEMVDAVHRIDELDPDACRHRAAAFDAASMCAGYERVYNSIVRRNDEQLSGAA